MVSDEVSRRTVAGVALSMNRLFPVGGLGDVSDEGPAGGFGYVVEGPAAGGAIRAFPRWRNWLSREDGA